MIPMQSWNPFYANRLHFVTIAPHTRLCVDAEEAAAVARFSQEDDNQLDDFTGQGLKVGANHLQYMSAFILRCTSVRPAASSHTPLPAFQACKGNALKKPLFYSDRGTSLCS